MFGKILLWPVNSILLITIFSSFFGSHLVYFSVLPTVNLVSKFTSHDWLKTFGNLPYQTPLLLHKPTFVLFHRCIITIHSKLLQASMTINTIFSQFCIKLLLEPPKNIYCDHSWLIKKWSKFSVSTYSDLHRQKSQDFLV